MSNQVAPMVGGADGSLPLTKDSAKMLLQQVVDANCCYGKEPARDLLVDEIRSAIVTFYELQTCTESRSVILCEQPYAGMPIVMGMIKPGMWDIMVPRPTNFVAAVSEVEVPNSSIIKVCGRCGGDGAMRCPHCGGRAFVSCHSCHGRRVRNNGEVCHACMGSGNAPCRQCASGRVRCTSCSGSGKVRMFEKLIVRWQVLEGNHAVKGNSSFPNSLLSRAAGVVVFSDMQPKLLPLTNYPIAEVNSASVQLLQAHDSLAASTGLIVQQRHYVKNVKVSECDYHWKDSHGTFYVYGANQVFAPDYPHTCCCCRCTVL